MDWEKQDNELRKLMEGNDFLPDGENWNASKSWQQLREAKEGTTKNKRRWLPLAAAACAAALVGLFFWWSVPNVVSNEVATTKQVAVPAKAEGAKLPKPATDIADKTESEKTEVAVVVTKNKTSTPAGSSPNKKQLEVIGKVNDSAGSVKENSLVTVSIPQPELINPAAATLVPERPLPNTNQPQVTVAKKPAIKVIHYNSLNSSSPVAPPVFVKLTKSESRWQMQELQEPANTKQSAVMLKIDLSPAPKKPL